METPAAYCARAWSATQVSWNTKVQIHCYQEKYNDCPTKITVINTGETSVDAFAVGKVFAVLDAQNEMRWFL